MKHIGPDVGEARARVATRRGLPPFKCPTTPPTQLRHSGAPHPPCRRPFLGAPGGSSDQERARQPDGTFCLRSLSMLIVDASQPEEAT